MPNGHGIFTFPEVSMQPSLAIGGYVAAGVIAGFKDTVNTKSIIWTSFITGETLDCDGYLILGWWVFFGVLGGGHISIYRSFPEQSHPNIRKSLILKLTWQVHLTYSDTVWYGFLTVTNCISALFPFLTLRHLLCVDSLLFFHHLCYNCNINSYEHETPVIVVEGTEFYQLFCVENCGIKKRSDDWLFPLSPL